MNDRGCPNGVENKGWGIKMQPVVYVDVLLVLNFVVNYLLLCGSGYLAGRQIQRWRVLLAAFLGSLFSLVIFLPALPTISMALVKLLAALLLSLVAFPWIGIWRLVKDTIILFIVSFLLAGILLAVWVQLTPVGMLCYNGVFYFPINLMAFIVITSVAYLFILLFSRIFHGKEQDTDQVEVRLVLHGKSMTLTGRVDSCNHLREPFSGIPVAVCWVKDVAAILPLEVVSMVCSQKLGEISQMDCSLGLRMVPYHTVAGHGALLALRPDAMFLRTNSRTYQVESVFLGLSPDPIGNGQYNLLLSEEMIKLKIH